MKDLILPFLFVVIGMTLIGYGMDIQKMSVAFLGIGLLASGMMIGGHIMDQKEKKKS